MAGPVENYLVVCPGVRREIIAASEPRLALRTFCRRHPELARTGQLRVELLEEALARGEGELNEPP